MGRNVKRGASRKASTGRKTARRPTRAAPPVLKKDERVAMPHTFHMDKQCTLREAEALKLALHAAEDTSGDLTVDAGAVEKIDTAGLQLLIAFGKKLQLLERRLVWGPVSPALRTTAGALGLTEALGLPEVSA